MTETDRLKRMASAREAVLGAASALDGKWSENWLVRLRDAAVLLAEQDGLLDELSEDHAEASRDAVHAYVAEAEKIGWQMAAKSLRRRIDRTQPHAVAMVRKLRLEGKSGLSKGNPALKELGALLLSAADEIERLWEILGGDVPPEESHP